MFTLFDFSIDKVANTVVEMSGVIGVEYKTIWGEEGGELIKNQFFWEEIEEYINDKINLGRSKENEHV